MGAAKVAGKAKAGLANLGNAIGGAGKRAGNKVGGVFGKELTKSAQHDVIRKAAATSKAANKAAGKRVAKLADARQASSKVKGMSEHYGENMKQTGGKGDKGNFRKWLANKRASGESFSTITLPDGIVIESGE